MKSVLILLVGILGCAPRVKIGPPDFTPPNKVALLLLDNQSNDLQVVGLVRELFFRKLKDRGFKLVALQVVDTTLFNIGITDGGQLRAIEPRELFSKLCADWLIYGTILKADYITTGIYSKKEVKMKFKIVSAMEDTTIWEGEGTGLESDINLNLKEAGKKLFEQIKEKVISNIFDHPLRREAEEAINEASRKLPYPSGYYAR
ncbi:DUF799 family lipoprotein [candidate division WOR-3 bacterium]|nr:DUF799 family lipoprotein [candidate division WOR-3 bacterium]